MYEIIQTIGPNVLTTHAAASHLLSSYGKYRSCLRNAHRLHKVYILKIESDDLPVAAIDRSVLPMGFEVHNPGRINIC